MSGTRRLDIDFVRRQFPALGSGPYAEWAFFENAGGTYVPRSVIERTGAYMTQTQVQPGTASAASTLAAERIAEGERQMAEMIKAEPGEVMIGPSTTMNMYLLSHAIGEWFGEGDELIVTNQDHEANIGAWRRLAERGVTVKEWRVDPETAELEIGALESLLSARTKLVCFPHCSNLLGGFNDVAGITRVVHDAGALVCVDAVAYAPHRAIDVKAWDVDFYGFSLYKLFGPHIAVLYAKRQHFDRARGQNHYFLDDEVPLKLLPGGPNHEFTAAIGGVIDYFEALYHHHFEEPENTLAGRIAKVFGLIAAYEDALGARFVRFLESKPNVRLLGRGGDAPGARAPTFSFAVDGRDPAEFPAHMDGHKVAIRSGHFYALRLIAGLGLERPGAVTRASMVHYNSTEEVDRLIAGLDEVI
ncbi:MAG: cysteine desulfurase-like protein [Alphaproteobacteria bacterium]